MRMLKYATKINCADDIQLNPNPEPFLCELASSLKITVVCLKRPEYRSVKACWFTM